MCIFFLLCKSFILVRQASLIPPLLEPIACQIAFLILLQQFWIQQVSPLTLE